MSRALIKEFFREIRGTLNRFLSILIIMMLGVAFFAGVRAAKPDMRLTADAYYDRYALTDIMVQCTLGLTDADVATLQNANGVQAAEGVYSADLFCTADGQQKVLRLFSVGSKTDLYSLTEGRMPEANDECIVDSRFLQAYGISVGDCLHLSADGGKIDETLSGDAFTIVGACNSPMYMSRDRGTAAIGDGSVAGFAAVLPGCFRTQYYNRINLLLDGGSALCAYTEEYDDLSGAAKANISALTDGIAERRLADVKNEAQQQIADAKAAVSSGETALADAQQQLSDGKKALLAADAELQEKRQELSAAKQTLDSAGQQLTDGEQRLSEGSAELDRQQAELDSGRAQLAAAEEAAAEGERQLEESRRAVSEMRTRYEQLKTALGADAPQVRQLAAAVAEGENKLLLAKEALAGTKAQLAEQKTALDAAQQQLDSARGELTEQAAVLADKRAQYESGLAAWESGSRQLSGGEDTLAAKRRELADGQSEYDSRYDAAQAEISDAQQKISDGETKLSELSSKIYLSDRNDFVSYRSYGDDLERIGNIVQVFPLIFFIVAAFVSLTTMTRMVEEERTQIGTLKALGYGRGAIMLKFILYGLSATLVGSVIGLYVGQKLFPWVIMNTYKMLYVGISDFQLPVHLGYSLASTGIAVACILAATVSVCYSVTAATPAELMRPAVPKVGKRVLLERIPFLWNRLKFTYKSTFRNIFRYKKRLCMMVLGISACMALLLVGFGLRDSIIKIAKLQFDGVEKVDCTVIYDGSSDDSDALLIDMQNDPAVTDMLGASMSLTEVKGADRNIEVTLTVPDAPAELGKYMLLRDRNSGEEYSLDNSGAIISEKLSRLLKVSPGDSITLLRDGEEYAVPVAKICENYVHHYVYLTPQLYRSVFGESAENNTLLLNEPQREAGLESALGERILSHSSVLRVSFNREISASLDDMLISLNAVVIVLILSAGALAFVVLYNLNNININERRRELATIKLLGFYDLELSGYVYRENVILTALGIALGLVLGRWLHSFIITTCEVDIMMFGRSISFTSYLWSVLCTIGFAAIVNLLMFFKLRKINMVDSLKSVE